MDSEPDFIQRSQRGNERSFRSCSTIQNEILFAIESVRKDIFRRISKQYQSSFYKKLV